MGTFTLPALRANDTLGFLAALGVTKLCELLLDDPAVRIGWPDGSSVGATISTAIAEDVDSLAAALQGVAERLNEPDLVPGAPGFPPNSEKTADSDPVRTLTQEAGRRLARKALDAPAFEPWLVSVVALDEAIRGEKRRGSLAVTPFAARGPGTVMLARTLRDLAAAASTGLAGALTFWERADSVAGYLDARAKRDAAFAASRHDKGNYGVAAAAWLAMMSLPYFPAHSSGGDIATAPAWDLGRRGLPVFTWPVWPELLDPSAITVLLSHPETLKRVGTGLEALGVVEVYISERTLEGNNDGPMSMARRVWPV